MRLVLPLSTQLLINEYTVLHLCFSSGKISSSYTRARRLRNDGVGDREILSGAQIALARRSGAGLSHCRFQLNSRSFSKPYAARACEDKS